MSIHPKRTGIMLAMPFEERRLMNQGRFDKKWSPPYILQPKLDGERCRALKEGERVLLLSSTEEIITSVPHIQEALLLLPDGEYDGELYRHEWTFNQIHSVVSRERNMHSDYEEIKFHIFDIVTPETQMHRLKHLIDLSGVCGPLEKVLPRIATNLDQIYDLYSEFIDDGYEGFIIRDCDGLYERKRSGHMMKFKPKGQDYYLITGLYEAISQEGQPKGMVGGFNLVDDMGTTFNAGAGKLDHEMRKIIWNMYLDSPGYYIGKYLLTEYQTLNEYKVPRHGRAVKVVNKSEVK